MKVFISRSRTESAKKYLEEHYMDIIVKVSELFNHHTDDISLIDPDPSNERNYYMDFLNKDNVDVAIFSNEYNEFDEKEHTRIDNELKYCFSQNIPVLIIG